MGQAADGEIPPMMAQRIKEASPEELEGIKERMKQFGLSDERIEEVIKQIRGDSGMRLMNHRGTEKQRDRGGHLSLRSSARSNELPPIQKGPVWGSSLCLWCLCGEFDRSTERRSNHR